MLSLEFDLVCFVGLNALPETSLEATAILDLKISSCIQRAQKIM